MLANVSPRYDAPGNRFAAAPYLYLAAQASAIPLRAVPVIVAGTWLDQVARMNPGGSQGSGLPAATIARTAWSAGMPRVCSACCRAAR